MPYVFLLLAIVGEVVGTSLLRATDGFTRLLPTAAVAAAYTASFYCLSRVVRELPVGITYAIWAGLGTVLIVLIGVTFLGERITVSTAVGVALVIAGVVVLNLSGAH
ncbi:MAG: ligand-binding protein SH3 [Nocardioides sp.]|nr:ligand-binding protein SH3 [Nocardioides sp.]